MKRDMELIRKILFEIEEKLSIDLIENLSDIKEDILQWLQHLNKCGNFGFHPRVMCTTKKCMGHVSHPRMSEHQNYHEKLGNLVSRFSFCAFWDLFQAMFR